MSEAVMDRVWIVLHEEWDDSAKIVAVCPCEADAWQEAAQAVADSLDDPDLKRVREQLEGLLRDHEYEKAVARYNQETDSAWLSVVSCPVKECSESALRIPAPH